MGEHADDALDNSLDGIELTAEELTDPWRALKRLELLLLNPTIRELDEYGKDFGLKDARKRKPEPEGNSEDEDAGWSK